MSIRLQLVIGELSHVQWQLREFMTCMHVHKVCQKRCTNSRRHRVVLYTYDHAPATHVVLYTYDHAPATCMVAIVKLHGGTELRLYLGITHQVVKLSAAVRPLATMRDAHISCCVAQSCMNDWQRP